MKTSPDSERSSLLSLPEIFADNWEELTCKALLNRNTLLLGTYLVFHLLNIIIKTALRKEITRLKVEGKIVEGDKEWKLWSVTESAGRGMRL
ncbi:hypothetical protein ACLOAV_002335 [Pseudogymnoascus australis]